MTVFNKITAYFSDFLDTFYAKNTSYNKNHVKRHQSNKWIAKGMPLNQSAQLYSKQETKISLNNCDVTVVQEK